MSFQKNARRKSIRRPGRKTGRVRVGKGRLATWFGQFDGVLFVLVACLAGCGLLNLFSATLDSSHAAKFSQQLLWMTVAASVYFVLTVVDYRVFLKPAWLFVVFVVVTMLMVKIFSDPIKGSNRWLLLGPFRFQPSEPTKIALILAASRMLHEAAEQGGRWVKQLPKILILALPILMILWQPDLGSASLCILIVSSMAMLMAKTIWPLFLAGGALVASLPFTWTLMHDYQRLRVQTFLGLVKDPTGASWQTEQSVNAVGSGQLLGKGFHQATQNQLEFLPEHWTDFPYSVWAEEWGFIGSVALLGLFLLLIVWCIRVALGARDTFGQGICVGAAAMIFWHVLVNVLMVLGLAPVVGVTLPLISYGGSSLLTFCAALGLVSSVSARRAN